MKTNMKDHDLVSDVIRYEDGEMDFNETVSFFQELIDIGLIWELQGSYQRVAKELIREGWCQL